MSVEAITRPRDPLREFIDNCNRQTGWIRAMGVASALLHEAGQHDLSHRLSMLSFKHDLVHVDDIIERTRDCQAYLFGLDHPAISNLPE